MRVLSLVNQKGGCGKTTAAINLAAALSARGARVLVADLDPQAHASLGLSHDSDGGASIADVLLRERALEDCLVAAPGGIMLLPGSARLTEFEDTSARELAPQRRLREALEGVEARFDYALIDCPARADGLLAASALVASDVALLVIETGAFALQGAIRALRLIEAAGERHGARFEVKVLATLFDRRTRFARELLIALHARFGQRMFDTAIRTHVRLREAAACGVPVRVLDAKCAAAAEFDALAGELAGAWLRSDRARPGGPSGETEVGPEHAPPGQTWEVPRGAARDGSGEARLALRGELA